MASARFHFAVEVGDLETAEKFYTEVIGCETGDREPGNWVDINFWDNELTLHASDTAKADMPVLHPTDMKDVAVPHFGVHLDADVFAKLKQRLAEHKIKYIDEPYVRFEGTELEQETMFIADPYGNAMEIKTMKNPEMLWKINK